MYTNSNSYQNPVGPSGNSSNNNGIANLSNLDCLGEAEIDELLSLGSANFNGDEGDTWRLTNPVHMEVQDNARIPTLNTNVDRSGSVPYPQYQRFEMDMGPMLLKSNSGEGPNSAGGIETTGEQQSQLLLQQPQQPISDDVSLGEMFLLNRRRERVNQTYAQAGVLRQDTTRRMQTGPNWKQQQQQQKSFKEDPMELMDLSIDPTPLSVIKERAQKRHEHDREKRSMVPTVPPPPPLVESNDSGNPQQQLQSYSNGLNISEAVADAVASAIATTKPLPPTTVARSLAASIPLSITAGRPRPQYNVPQASKHAASIPEASFRQSQYGFGTNHQVPSIPYAGKRKKKATSQEQDISKSSNDGAASIDSPAGRSSSEAYERKKKRAKDARVKLNDSIDRLATAINLAGTQSELRLQQCQKIPVLPNVGEQHRAATMQIMQSCVQTAESARKWDRPSFVGTAATLIQSLNAQSEILMRELAAAHSALGQQGGNDDGHMSGNKRTRDNEQQLHQQQKQQQPLIVTDAASVPFAADANDSSGQQQTVSQPQSLLLAQTIFADPRLTERVALFLDPSSLLNCYQVSRQWYMNMRSDKVWEQLAVARFGVYAIRQWQGLLDNDDNEDTTMIPPISFQDLYKGMAMTHVMPHSPMDGHHILGQACLPGIVSAWVSLVERSNGETMRSVRRASHMSYGGPYVSMPVVELRVIVQNTGSTTTPLIIPTQVQAVDASTRRRAEEMCEITWDDRFQKRLFHLDGTPWQTSMQPAEVVCGAALTSVPEEEMCRLQLFESVVISMYIHARGCATLSKFVRRSNLTRILIQTGGSGGTTTPLVVHFMGGREHQDSKKAKVQI